MRLAKILSYLFHGPAWLTFLIMGAAAGGFAVCTFNLYELFSANFRLVTTYGGMALLDGGLLQLVQLTFWGYLGVACYLLFKGCVHGLLERVPHRAAKSADPTPPGEIHPTP
jgi:hypothetical protein